MSTIILMAFTGGYWDCLKKNLNASQPYEHPIQAFRWKHRRPRQDLFMTFNYIHSPMVVALGQQYNVGEKPTIILYAYINRHADTPKEETKTDESGYSSILFVSAV